MDAALRAFVSVGGTGGINLNSHAANALVNALGVAGRLLDVVAVVCALVRWLTITHGSSSAHCMGLNFPGTYSGVPNACAAHNGELRVKLR